jgi:hypothetical protein
VPTLSWSSTHSTTRNLCLLDFSKHPIYFHSHHVDFLFQRDCCQCIRLWTDLLAIQASSCPPWGRFPWLPIWIPHTDAVSGLSPASYSTVRAHSKINVPSTCPWNLWRAFWSRWPYWWWSWIVPRLTVAHLFWCRSHGNHICPAKLQTRAPHVNSIPQYQIQGWLLWILRWLRGKCIGRTQRM